MNKFILIIKKIKSVIKIIICYKRWGNTNNYKANLDKLGYEMKRISAKIKSINTTVLIGPSFCIYGPSYSFDRLLSYALQLRGIDVLPLYCDGIQKKECNYFGGVWGGGPKFAANCKLCVSTSQQLWYDNPVPPIVLSNYLEPSDVKNIDYNISSIKDDSWINYCEDGIQLGHLAKDILVNNYVVGDYKLIPNNNLLGLSHLRNLMILNTAYKKIFEIFKLDRVISNDSFYGMWFLIQEICKNKNIPFYSHWTVNKKRISFAYNDAAMNLNFRSAWSSFSKKSLNNRQKELVENWLERKPYVRNSLIETASVSSYQNIKFDFQSICSTKSTALLCTNVIWDLSALNKQIIFNNMIDWIIQTINWFKSNTQFQLIVKSHPLEQNPSVPETKERVEIALKEAGVIIPPNVILLSPKINISVYDLFDFVKVGIVHTTSVGFEMPAFGIPVITTARAPYRGFGFTLDPNNREEYFELLSRVLNGDAIIDKTKMIDYAYKYILFSQFHYYANFGLFESEWGKDPVLKIKSAKELLPGKNSVLDYFIDSIIEGKPLLGENRWPPES